MITEEVTPGDEKEACSVIAEAMALGHKLEIAGGCGKQTVGRPMREGIKLSTSKFGRIVDYDPAELVLTLQPGAKLSDIEALLAQHGQMLAFEPVDFAETTGGAGGATTIGGIVGSGFAGPRRLSAGGVRDHMLGVAAISGRGVAFKAGGRVVKNVTGYDLPKLMAGSWGRLGLMTEMTLKVLPKAREARTLAMRGLSEAEAVSLMARAMRSTADVAACAHAPLSGDPRACVTGFRLEGFAVSLAARAETLAHVLKDGVRVETLPAEEAEAFWRAVRSVSPLKAAAGEALWRIVSPPAAGARVSTALAALGGRTLLDWAGGLIWARLSPDVDALKIRQIAQIVDGRAMLVEGPEALRASTPILHPEPPALAGLSERVRLAFDPQGVFETGRFSIPEAAR